MFIATASVALLSRVYLRVPVVNGRGIRSASSTRDNHQVGRHRTKSLKQ